MDGKLGSFENKQAGWLAARRIRIIIAPKVLIVECLAGLLTYKFVRSKKIGRGGREREREQFYWASINYNDDWKRRSRSMRRGEAH